MKILKFILLFMLLTFAGKTFANEAIFTVIADSNIQSDKKNNSMTPSISRLLKAKDDINSTNANFVIFLGNNTARADKYDLVMFGKIINKIKKPVYVGLGSHDIQKTRGLEKKDYYKYLNRFSKNRISKLPTKKNLNGFVFVFMDGTNEIIPSQRGYFKEKELIYLDKVLKNNQDKDVIIVQHFPVISSSENSSKNTHKVEEYIKTLENHKNVRAIISAHMKEDFETEDERGIKHITVPPLSGGDYKIIKINSNNGFTIQTKTISLD